MFSLKKNLLQVATFILLVIEALFGLAIIAMSIYIGAVLIKYVDISYGVYILPGSALGLVTVLVVAGILYEKFKTDSTCGICGICGCLKIIFAFALGVLAATQFVTGLCFLAQDYERRGVEYDGVKYIDQAAAYEVILRPLFKAKLDGDAYSTIDISKMPEQTTLDRLQKDFKCCGLSGAHDYIDVRGSAVLRSCCRKYGLVEGVPLCDNYDRGCVRPFYEWLTDKLVGFGALVFVASLFTVLVVISGVIVFLDGVSVGAIFTKYEQKFSPANSIRTMILLFGVFFGVLLVGVGALVLLGAFTRQRPALIAGTVLLSLLSVAQFICGVVLFGGLVWNAVLPSFQHRTGYKCKDQLLERMSVAFSEAYSVAPKVDESGTITFVNETRSSPEFDLLQTDFKCCGVQFKYADYGAVGTFPPKSCCDPARATHRSRSDRPRQGQDDDPWTGPPKEPGEGPGQGPPMVTGPGGCAIYPSGCVDPYFSFWRALALQFAVLLTLLSVFPMLDCVGTTAMLYGLSSRGQPTQ